MTTLVCAYIAAAIAVVIAVTFVICIYNAIPKK